jgi:uncharacterized protein YbcI
LDTLKGVFDHVGFFMHSTVANACSLFVSTLSWHKVPETHAMLHSTQEMAQQIAEAATALQEQRTGHEPTAVSVVLSGDTLVITLHGALSAAERAMAQTAEGAAKVQEFHRELFLNGSGALLDEIKRITGMDVKEAAAEVEPTSGSVVHVFTSGTMVQMFLLSGDVPSGTFISAGKT